MNMARTRCEEETSGNWRVGARKFGARGWSAMNKGRDWPRVTFIPAGIAKNKDAVTTTRRTHDDIPPHRNDIGPSDFTGVVARWAVAHHRCGEEWWGGHVVCRKTKVIRRAERAGQHQGLGHKSGGSAPNLKKKLKSCNKE